MIIKLFDIQNNVIVPTEHCYTLKSLKDIMDEYPEDHLKIYQYLFYMTCPNPDLNPFFYTPENDKEDLILKEIQAAFSTEDKSIWTALQFCRRTMKVLEHHLKGPIKIYRKNKKVQLEAELVWHMINNLLIIR
jgi:hypothetical protein